MCKLTELQSGKLDYRIKSCTSYCKNGYNLDQNVFFKRKRIYQLPYGHIQFNVHIKSRQYIKQNCRMRRFITDNYFLPNDIAIK